MNILKAYSLYDKEVGYCQGSPFITGLLLMKVSYKAGFRVTCSCGDVMLMGEGYSSGSFLELFSTNHKIILEIESVLPVVFKA